MKTILLVLALVVLSVSAYAAVNISIDRIRDVEMTVRPLGPCGPAPAVCDFVLIVSGIRAEANGTDWGGASAQMNSAVLTTVQQTQLSNIFRAGRRELKRVAISEDAE